MNLVQGKGNAKHHQQADKEAQRITADVWRNVDAVQDGQRWCTR